MRFASLVVLGLISPLHVPAQQTSLSGPVEAFTYDAPTRSLRAVIGFPGAASFGPVLLDSLDFASVAPLQNYGVILQGGTWLLASGLGSKTVSTHAIAGVTRYPEGMVWSGNGSLAILYSRAGGWFQTIAGFPAAPVAGTVVEVSSLGGSFTAIAVDAQGKQIVVAVSGDKGALYQAAGQSFVPLASMSNPVSLSFSSDGQTLYALDAATLQITAVSLAGNGFQTLALPGMTNPIAIQAIQDSQSGSASDSQSGRQLLYIAGGSDRMLRILDAASQQILTDVPLNLKPTGLAVFGSGSFVLASRAQSANPLWLFSNTPQPGAYFVPAVQLRRPDHKAIAISGRTR